MDFHPDLAVGYSLRLYIEYYSKLLTDAKGNIIITLNY